MATEDDRRTECRPLRRRGVQRLGRGRWGSGRSVSAVTREDTGPGGAYARLAELGHEPVPEEIRSRMPSRDEADRLRLAAGTPVVLVCRTAFMAEGRAVEVNEMTLDASSYVLEYDFDAAPS
ncbi:hypothetical protein GCM10010259_52370 [Streptomyces daghestanicus]|uniref:DNA-binding GntR family transcriptional regulator n=2 Tax=Streptomyces TaxID=1883 RepID=A0ABT9LFY7_STRGD|nr:DNA-binding GntR family transcriptional regulator [Streptomyces griseoviridis]GGT11538.1 hypothetical protein GCM10010240_51340 [Streptomyces griseoviridis]GGU54674.1 hypothetical protein GCM10010259_52370 [Streptomyces daghestanicus]GHI32272.1 hypothetical protein Sdagh_40020 [Streptomyces daghestanicus]